MMIKYCPIEEFCKKLEVYLKNMVVIPKTPFSGGVQTELTHQGGCGSNQLSIWLSTIAMRNLAKNYKPVSFNSREIMAKPRESNCPVISIYHIIRLGTVLGLDFHIIRASSQCTYDFLSKYTSTSEKNNRNSTLSNQCSFIIN